MGLFDSLYQPNWFNPQNLAQSLNFTPGTLPQVPQMPAVAPTGPLGSSLAPVPGMPSSGSVLPNLNIGRGAVPVPTAAAGAPGVTAGAPPGTPDPNQPNSFWGNASAVAQGVGALGNLGLGIWGMVNATDAYNFQKNLAQNNYDNSVKSYNTAVEDRMRTRYATDPNHNPASIQAEIDKRRLQEK